MRDIYPKCAYNQYCELNLILEIVHILVEVSFLYFMVITRHALGGLIRGACGRSTMYYGISCVGFLYMSISWNNACHNCVIIATFRSLHMLHRPINARYAHHHSMKQFAIVCTLGALIFIIYT